MTLVEYGVRAILWRHQATPRRLLRVVRSVARGAGHLPPDLISRPLTQVGRLRRSAVTSASVAVAPTTGMAPREVDVPRLIAEGLDTRQMSEKLACSERAVKNVLLRPDDAAAPAQPRAPRRLRTTRGIHLMSSEADAAAGKKAGVGSPHVWAGERA